MEQENELKASSDKEEKLESYKKELTDILHKSQDTFEKQLSYISAGSLALSIGFVKDIVKDITLADYRPLLMLGWVLLVITLLANLSSHLYAVGLLGKSISEISGPTYDSKKSDNRFKVITIVNWGCIATLTLGILFIALFVYFNL